MSTRIFRALLVASFLLAVIANSLDTLYPSLLSEPHQVALQTQIAAIQSGKLANQVLMALCCLLAALVSTIGLWHLTQWALWLATATSIAGLLLLPSMGSYAISGWALGVSQLAAGAWCVVLAAGFSGVVPKSNFADAA